MKLFNKECQEKDDRPEGYLQIKDITYAVGFEKCNMLTTWVAKITYNNRVTLLGEFATRSEATNHLENFVKAIKESEV